MSFTPPEDNDLDNPSLTPDQPQTLGSTPEPIVGDLPEEPDDLEMLEVRSRIFIPNNHAPEKLRAALHHFMEVAAEYPQFQITYEAGMGGTLEYTTRDRPDASTVARSVSDRVDERSPPPDSESEDEGGREWIRRLVSNGTTQSDPMALSPESTWNQLAALATSPTAVFDGPHHGHDALQVKPVGVRH